MGLRGRANLVYLLDLGLAKLFADPSTGEHIAMREDRVPFGPGTPLYSSANVQFRRGGLSRRSSDESTSLTTNRQTKADATTSPPSGTRCCTSFTAAFPGEASTRPRRRPS